MAFSEMKLAHPSREQTQISGLNPNVAMVMCQSFEGMKVWAFSPVGSSPDGPLLSQKIKVGGVLRRQRGINPSAVFDLRI